MNINKLIKFLSEEKNQNIFRTLRSLTIVSINELQEIEAEYPDIPIKDLFSLLNIQKNNRLKIPDIQKYIFSEKGVQQASSKILAEYHAEKMQLFSVVADLCCGNGMDLMHIAVSKKKVYAVDLDENSLALAEFNCRAAGLKNIIFLKEAAEQFAQKIDAIFADPDRRPDSKRKVEPNDISPSLDDILKLNKLTDSMAIKLSPAMNYKTMQLPEKSTLEFVSENGVLKEILLCTGELATNGVLRKAVLLPQQIVLQNNGCAIAVEPVSNYIFEPDKAIIRSGLVQECGARIGYNLIDSKLALLSGEKPVFSKLGKCYRIVQIMNYNLKKIKKFCHDKNLGELVIKTRGFPMSVEALRQKINLKLKGDKKLIMFVLRRDKRHNIIFADHVL